MITVANLHVGYARAHSFHRATALVAHHPHEAIGARERDGLPLNFPILRSIILAPLRRARSERPEIHEFDN